MYKRQEVVGKQLIDYDRDGIENIPVRNPFVIESRRGSNRKVIALIAVPLCVDTVQGKRHDGKHICTDRGGRPGRIDFTGSNIFDVI